MSAKSLQQQYSEESLQQETGEHPDSEVLKWSFNLEES